MADIAEGETITAVFPYAAPKNADSASDGRGFIASQDEMVAAPAKANCF